MVSTRKRIGAALAALALAFAAMLCFANPAWADEPDYSKTVTVTGVSVGDTVNAYKLIGYAGGNYNEYDYDASSFDEYIENEHSNELNGESIEHYLSELSGTEMASLLNGYMKNWGQDYAKPTSSAAGTATNGDAAALTLTEPGYYLITVSTTEDNSKIYLPTSVFIKVDGTTSKISAGDADFTDAKAVTLRMKSDKAPIIEKKVQRMDDGNGARRKPSALVIQRSFTSLSRCPITPTPL